MWPLGLTLPSWLEGPLGLVVAALLYFGVPYVVFMVSLLWILRTASVAAHVWAAVLAPVVMALVVVPGFLWVVGIRGVELRESWSLFAKLSLEIGCAYVAVALVGLLLGLRVGFVRRIKS